MKLFSNFQQNYKIRSTLGCIYIYYVIKTCSPNYEKNNVNYNLSLFEAEILLVSGWFNNNLDRKYVDNKFLQNI